MAKAGFKSGKAGLSAADLLVQFGPTLLVDIGLRSKGKPEDPPDLARKGVRALIDTGAGGAQNRRVAIVVRELTGWSGGRGVGLA